MLVKIKSVHGTKYVNTDHVQFFNVPGENERTLTLYITGDDTLDLEFDTSAQVNAAIGVLVAASKEK